jgi:hypothetical protein
MPHISHRGAQRQNFRQSQHRLGHVAAIRSCTIALPDGAFCDRPIPDDAPISACTEHLQRAWSYCQAKLDLATDAHLAVIREDIPRLSDQRLMDRVRRARSVVYYALADGYVKIGTTVHLDARMKALGANLVAVEPGDAELERDRHRQFHALLAAGREYFFPGHELIAHIAALQERYTQPEPPRLARR